MTVHLRLLDAIGMYCAIRSLSHLNPRGLGEQSLHPVVVIGPQNVRADRSARNCGRIKKKGMKFYELDCLTLLYFLLLPQSGLWESVLHTTVRLIFWKFQFAL